MNPRHQKTEPSHRIAYYRPRLGRGAFAPRHWPSWALLALLWLCAWLPLRAARALGAALGLLTLAVNDKRRRIARINLELCFPELAADARERLLRRHFIVSGQAFVDLGALAWAPARRVLRHTRITGLELYREQIARGRNVILLAPHCVGMNFGGSVIAGRHPLFTMIKAQRDPVVNWLLNKGRTRFGSELLLRHQGLRPAIRALKEGLTFCYLPDEDFGPRHSVFAPFFGVPTATLTTLGRMAAMADAVVIPCFTRLLPRGRGYEVILRPPLTDFPGARPADDAARMNRALEDGIRRMPEQYMWTFKLFKTRPGGAPSPYA